MSILSLAPPLAVFIIGFATRKMRFALTIGIIISALIATQVDILASLQLTLHHFMNALEIGQGDTITASLFSDRLSILSCLIFFGILTEIICRSNAAAAFQAYSRSFVSDKRSAESSCIALSLILCIDDYLSAIVVGSVMQPIASRFAIAKAKLAYLCNSLSSPVAAMIPFSSWAAAIIGTLMESGINEQPTTETVLIGSPYAVLLSMIPYMLYSLALLTSVIFIVRNETSYSFMHQKELEASAHTQLNVNIENPHLQGSIWDFTLPIASLLGTILLGLLYSGGFALFGGPLSFFDAILNARVSQTLLGATAFASLISLCYYIARGTFQWKDCPSLFLKGSQLMTSAILMLSLTWTLTGLMKEELHTGTYIASLIGDWIPLALLPLITFWLASATFFLMGSSWGTMAILMPIIVSMIAKLHATTTLSTELAAASDIPLLLPTLAAVVSGSVFGNHVSLISDTSLMAASSTGCDLLDHFKTKFMYGLPIFISSSIGFLATGFFPSAGALLPATLAIGIPLTLMLAWQKLETNLPISPLSSE